jgi:hypothetical protein
MCTYCNGNPDLACTACDPDCDSLGYDDEWNLI